MTPNWVQQYIASRVTSMLTTTCAIERQSRSTGAMGEILHTWERIGTNVPCRLIRIDAGQDKQASIVGGQETLTDQYRLIIPAAQTVDVNYRVLIAGDTYTIIGVQTDLTDRTFNAVLLSRQREGM